MRRIVRVAAAVILALSLTAAPAQGTPPDKFRRCVREAMEDGMTPREAVRFCLTGQVPGPKV